MGLALNWVAAALLALTTFTYVVIYTIWLKRRTPQNIVIGGAAGAFPPMIGWAAATGDVSLASLSLFLIIFFWTPPHFWALALRKNDDYRRAGIPMMPVVAGAASTKKQMLAYTLLLFPLALAPWFLGAAGMIYAIGAALLGLAFIVHAVLVLRADNARPAARMFTFSLFYLAALFALLMFDAAA
jgi:protoheme IX farnesyltransferase